MTGNVVGSREPQKLLDAQLLRKHCHTQHCKECKERVNSRQYTGIGDGPSEIPRSFAFDSSRC